MKFSIGYNPLLSKDHYLKYFETDSISEVYFSYIGTPSGHDMKINEKTSDCIHNDRNIENMINILSLFKKNRKKINLLLNASCYGKIEATYILKLYINDLILKLNKYNLYPDIVTVVSPYIASIFKSYYPDIEVRMSVLSCILSIHSMILSSNLFDSFYINLDLNRNLSKVNEIGEWCKKNNKKLCLVVNSGCIGNCPYKMNHGNISSHCYEHSILTVIPCFNIYDKTYKDRVLAFLLGNWIRPEDIHNYEGIIDIAKLDTRLVSSAFNKTIDSYVSGKCIDNLFEIMSLTAPYILNINNSKFPDDYFKKITMCTKRCDICKYCDSISNLFKE